MELGAPDEVPGPVLQPLSAAELCRAPSEPGTVKHVLSSLMAVETAQEAPKDVQRPNGNEKEEKTEKPKEKTANEDQL